MRRALITWTAILVGILFFQSGALAVTISYTPIKLTESTWQYNYTVTTTAIDPIIDEFTIYFDRTLYSELLVRSSPVGWDSLVIQSDFGLPSNGFFDALALGAGLATGNSRDGFSVVFSFLGVGMPGPQGYDVIDPGTLEVIGSGWTTPAVTIPPSTNIPEPDSLLLIAISLPLLITFHKYSLSKKFFRNGSRWPFHIVWIFFCVLNFCNVSMAVAKPTIEGYDLVSSVRVTRTVFDYVYSVRIQGDNSSYTEASVSVTSSSPSTTVIKGNVNVGRLDAGAFIRTQDTFTIRQDRAIAFDPSTLTMAFSGNRLPNNPGAGATRIGPVAFVEAGGRPGHSGVFEIQDENPTAGSTIGLTAEIFGQPVSSSYALLNSSKQVISQGTLINTNIKERFAALVTIPTQPFTLSVSAIGIDGKVEKWESARIYSPAAYRMRILPNTTLIKKGQSVPVTIELTSFSANENYTVSLLIPSNFSGNVGPWMVNIYPGNVTKINTIITAPLNGRDFTYYTISSLAFSTKNPAKKQLSNLRFQVE